MPLSSITLRQETATDGAGIYAAHVAAFGRDDEARLVNHLRESGGLVLSIAAIGDGTICGHIAFSDVIAEHNTYSKRLAALAPMAVLPAVQHLGIGSQLIKAGIAALAERGYGGVIVLGHPGYYPRFGFKRASLFGLRFQGDVPDSAYLALPLNNAGLEGVSGTISYHPCFASL